MFCVEFHLAHCQSNLQFSIHSLSLIINCDNFVHSVANKRIKRSFRSYFDNYLDEMATSACVAIGNDAGLYFAVRRACGSYGPSCNDICTSHTIRKQAQIWDPKK